MKRQLRGVQITYYFGGRKVMYFPELIEMTVDCHLGSLIITKDELLDYLEKRLDDKK